MKIVCTISVTIEIIVMHQIETSTHIRELITYSGGEKLSKQEKTKTITSFFFFKHIYTVIFLFYLFITPRKTKNKQC